MQVYKCADLDKTACTTQGLKNLAWYNGSMTSLLKCYQNNYGRCPSEAVCETGGECNDWTYELWEGMTKAKCRVPWVNGTEWGGPDWESCPSPQAEELTAAECAAKKGTVVSRAETEGECTRWKGCFHTTNHYITAIPEAPCKDEQKCSVEDYEWRDVLDWRSGVWTPSAMVARDWKPRAMDSRNKWGKLLSWSSIELLVSDAVYAILGRAYVNEALCMTEPMLQVAPEALFGRREAALRLVT
ncbi:hypothetical protein T484DRAFT_1859849 [Baffinella frigidus]|nr:hypothetical protein T484DRAFT_1859849 [Cryptophyta sp. CCMP2293]